jgi:hypothetical protein
MNNFARSILKPAVSASSGSSIIFRTRSQRQLEQIGATIAQIAPLPVNGDKSVGMVVELQ